MNATIPRLKRWSFVLLVTLPLYPSMQTQTSLDDAQRKALNGRVQEYTSGFRARNWAQVYGMVSKTGKGGATKQIFALAMERSHGKDYGTYPDILEFKSERMEAARPNEFDLHGCGKVYKQGWKFDGVVELHAVLEDGNWYFTGWRLTAFPAELCSSLKDPKWKPYTHENWEKSMEEIREYEKNHPQ